ncbi:MAG: hypothetical protein ACK55I_49600, partial [bacterium]
DVPCLGCTPPKLRSVLVSIQALTLPKLHCLDPAQFPRATHHPGCNVKLKSPTGLYSIFRGFSGPSDNV